MQQQQRERLERAEIEIRHRARVGRRGPWPFRSEASRRAYLQPLIILFVAMSVSLLWQHSATGADSVGLYLFQWTVSSILGLVALFVCSAIWIGFDAPWYLNLLRLGATFAMMDLMRFGVYQYVGPIMWGSHVIMGLLGGMYIWLLASLLDVEGIEAYVVAVILVALKVILWVFVFA